MRQAVAAIAPLHRHRMPKWPAEKWPLVARTGPPAMSAVRSLSGSFHRRRCLHGAEGGVVGLRSAA